MRIFKYTAHAKVLLEKCRIKLSSAHKLNDPFELSPRFDLSSFTPRAAARFLRNEEEIRFWYQSEGHRFPHFKAYRTWYLASIPQRAEKLLLNVPKNVEKAQQRFAETFSEHALLFCASKVRHSILMWSHYANNHEGSVVEFETNEKPFSTLGNEFIFPVVYSPERGDFDYSKFQKQKAASLMIEVARRKSPEWHYEEEVRAIFPRMEEYPEFCPFAPTAVKSVTFGCRCPNDTKKIIVEILNHPDFAHVIVLEARLHKEQFKLEFDTIRPAKPGP